MAGCEIVEYSMQRDHIHMVMIIPPREEKVFLVIGSILEGERSMVAWIFCIHGGDRRAEDTKVCIMAGDPGFRSSEA